MSLTNRLSLFFLAALAVVLAGFSVSVFVLARWHLHAQADLRLRAAMQTLVASTEVFPDHVEWEPHLRRITVGDDPGPEQVRWAAHGPDGTLVDCSQNLQQQVGGGELPADGAGWRVLVHRVEAGKFEGEPLAGGGELASSPLPGGGSVENPLSVSQRPEDRGFVGSGLVLTVAIREGPTHAMLAQLAWGMTLVSAVIWLTAAVWGRWLCRKALDPAVRMAAAARTIRQDPAGGRALDVAPTGDEFEDLGRAFNDLLTSLRDALTRQERFTGDASHQLRTPLAALQASVEVTLRQERGPAEYKRVLEVVRRRSDQLRQIIDSLLFLARNGAEVPLPDVKAVDLGEWSRAWLSGWDAHPRAADFDFRPAGGSTPVSTNPGLLGQALDNLLDNACKYSEPGSSITVAVEAGEGEAILTVSDRGHGIAADDLPLVWEPFFRSAQARLVGSNGAGLGLTVARRLVTLLGGRLDVRSAFGAGSQFQIVLPLSPTLTAKGGQSAGVREAAEGRDAVAR
ncbi:MAG: HAMP domain-containing sensor histidine kinase [Gemmataceae bacterium]